MDDLDILLVEDNPGDVRLTIEALSEGHPGTRVHVARDGVEAMAFLRRRAAFQEAVRPDLVLLDLNLPRKDGREVLAEVKADPDLRRIPVVILTTSSSDEDILKAYDLHANLYVTKPVELDSFMEVVRKLEELWGRFVQLPPK